MNFQIAVNLLLLHLGETTVERDEARAEVAQLRERIAELTKPTE